MFLRLCTTYTRQSNAVNLATNYFQQRLQADRAEGTSAAQAGQSDPRPRLSAERRGEEDALHHGAGQGTPALARRVGRLGRRGHAHAADSAGRALFGMGVGAAVAVASAGVAGTLLVKQFQSQQPPPLPVQESISGNPKFNFNLIPEPMKNRCIRSCAGLSGWRDHLRAAGSRV